jgi:hypothetical protein
MRIAPDTLSTLKELLTVTKKSQNAKGALRVGGHFHTLEYCPLGQYR